MDYTVIDPSGQRYGPVDEAELKQWAAEGRLGPTFLLESLDGETVVAGDALPEMFENLRGSPYPKADPEPTRSRYGIVSLTAGVVAILTVWTIIVPLFLGMFAILCGIIGNKHKDRALAITGIVLGVLSYFGLVGVVLLVMAGD